MKRTEVFIAYDPAVDSIHQLGLTLNAWDLPEYEPVAIEVRGKKQSDSERRDRLASIAAEGVAKGDYIIAELGSEPTAKKGYRYCTKGQGSIKVEACPERIQ